MWRLSRLVPELRTAARLTGMGMSKCRLILARPSLNGEPIPLDFGSGDQPGADSSNDLAKLAQNALDNFCGGMGGQTEVLGRVGELLTYTGEMIMLGSDDPGTIQANANYATNVYAPAQIVTHSKDKIKLRMGDSSSDDWEITLGDDAVYQLRIWRQDTQYNWQANSPARAALPILEKIAAFDARLQASTVSRLLGMGLLLVPEGMTLPGLPSAEDGDEVKDEFINLMIEIASIAIKNPESAAARLPIIIRGEADDIEKVRWMTFWSEYDDKILELRDAEIGRLATTMDMPKELLTGMADAQHWTASLIADDWASQYVPDLMGLVCGSLTAGWLYKKLGQVTTGDNIIVWFDASSLRTRPNQSDEAQALFKENGIGPKALRRANGFDEGDAPTKEELRAMLLIRCLELDPASLPDVLRELGLKGVTQWQPPTRITETGPIGGAPTVPADPAVGADPTTVASPGAAQPAVQATPTSSSPATQKRID